MDCIRFPSNPIWHCLSHESRSSTDNDESKEGSAKNPVCTLLYCEVVEGFECRSREAQSAGLLFVGKERPTISCWAPRNGPHTSLGCLLIVVPWNTPMRRFAVSNDEWNNPISIGSWDLLSLMRNDHYTMFCSCLSPAKFKEDLHKMETSRAVADRRFYTMKTAARKINVYHVFWNKGHRRDGITGKTKTIWRNSRLFAHHCAIPLSQKTIRKSWNS